MLDADVEHTSNEEIEMRLRTLQPVGLVIQLMYRNISAGLMLARLAKQLPTTPWVAVFEYAATLSGPALMDEDSNIDAVILGSPERALLAIAREPDSPAAWGNTPGLLLRDVEAGTWSATRNGDSSLELDAIPWPARDYLPISLQSFQAADIISSRGCHGRCTFCSIPALQRQGKELAWQARSAKNVLEEIRSLVADYGVTRFNFIDENFLGSRTMGQQRARELALLIRKSGLDIRYSIFCRVDDITSSLFDELRASGLRLVQFGIESGVPRLLQRYRKGIALNQISAALATLRELAIGAEPSFIMFEPSMSLSELEQNLRFVLAHDLPRLVSPTCVIPFNGTELTTVLRREGRISGTEYLVPHFLPDVTFADERVGQIRTIWHQWRSRLGHAYDDISRRAEDALREEAFLELPSDATVTESIRVDYGALKHVEAEFVLGLIRQVGHERRLQDMGRSLQRADEILQRLRWQVDCQLSLSVRAPLNAKVISGAI